MTSPAGWRPSAPRRAPPALPQPPLERRREPRWRRPPVSNTRRTGRASAKRPGGHSDRGGSPAPADAYARPAAEEWSAAEILAHLAEMLPYWAEQARAVAARGQDGEPFGRTQDDPDRIAAVRQHARDDLRELAAGVRASLDRAAAVLGAIPEPGWQRTGRHARRGEMSVTQIVEQFLVEHAEEHGQQLAAVLARLREGGAE
ncbi:MAG: DinB family protein [Chloroflexota bacterium]|nr:DinB family protein [Chloroflexota bacterium]